MPDEASPNVAKSVHPASLDPLSPGCLVPVFLTLCVLGVAYMGLQKIVSSTGPWALQAADKALVDSGIPEPQQVPFAAEIGRLRTALEAETLESEEVVNGVAGLLETPILPLLILNDVVDRRLPASGLTDEQRAAFLSDIEEFSRVADSQLIPYQGLMKVLGPLARPEEEGGPVDELTDEDFISMAERAQAAVAEVQEKAKLKNEEVEVDERPVPTYSVLLGRYREHVDAVLGGTADVIERSR